MEEEERRRKKKRHGPKAAIKPPGSKRGGIISQKDNNHTIGRLRHAGSDSKHAWGVSDRDLVGAHVIDEGKYTR